MKLFCYLVLLLDWIPRYGRFYATTRPERNGRVHLVRPKPEWRFLWHGMWGFQLLDRMGLLGPLIHEQLRRADERR